MSTIGVISRIEPRSRHRWPGPHHCCGPRGAPALAQGALDDHRNSFATSEDRSSAQPGQSSGSRCTHDREAQKRFSQVVCRCRLLSDGGTVADAAKAHRAMAVDCLGCPVHGGGDRTFVVTPGRGFFCFAEKQGGDQIALVSHVKEIPPKEAASFIAAHSGHPPSTVPSTVPPAHPGRTGAGARTEPLQPLSHRPFTIGTRSTNGQ